MSCNISIPLQRIIDDVAEVLAGNYISVDNPFLNESVLTDTTFRGDITMDTEARNALCSILQTCDITAVELEWLDRPTVADMVAVSEVVAGEVVVSWKDLDTLITEGIVGKVQTTDVLDSLGVSQEEINTDIRNELDALPFEDGALADTFVTMTSNGQGTIPRTLRDKVSDSIDVKDFGSLGDNTEFTVQHLIDSGVYSSIDEVNEKFDFPVLATDGLDWFGISALAHFAYVNNKNLVLPKGIYHLNKEVNIRTSVVGNGSTIISKVSNPAILFKVNDAGNIAIEGLKFKKDTDTGFLNGSGYPIHIGNNCNHITLRDITIDRYMDGVAANGAELTTPINSKFTIYKNNGSSEANMVLALVDDSGELKFTSSVSIFDRAGIQARIEELVGVGNVLVTGDGSQSNPYIVEFIGAWGNRPVLNFTATIVDKVGGKYYGVHVENTQMGGQRLNNYLSLDNVVIDNSTRFGINIDNTTELTLNNCKVFRSGLDGVKLRKHVYGVTILGGNYDYNGTTWFRGSISNPNAQDAGDGIDMYAGGSRVRIVAATFNYNTSGGLQLKNDAAVGGITGYASDGYGYNNRIDIIGIEASHNTSSAGLVITTNAGESSIPVSNISVLGGLYEFNDTCGILLACRNATVTNAKTLRNMGGGIRIYGGTDIELSGCIVKGNASHKTTNNFGIWLLRTCKNIVINGGFISSIDIENSVSGREGKSDVVRLAHDANIKIEVDCEDIFINKVNERHSLNPRGIIAHTSSDGSGGIKSPKNVIVHQYIHPDGTNNVQYCVGNIGSMAYNTTATSESNAVYIKTEGARSDTGVWKPLYTGAAPIQIGNVFASQALDKTKDVHLVRTGAIDNIVTLTLPLKSEVGVLGKVYTIKVYNGEGTIEVTPSSGDTINGSPSAIPVIGRDASIEIVADNLGWYVTNVSNPVTV